MKLYLHIENWLVYCSTSIPQDLISLSSHNNLASSNMLLHKLIIMQHLEFLGTWWVVHVEVFPPRNSHLHLQGFSDADWDGCVDARRSISDQCFFLGHSLISWRTKNKIIVSRSWFKVEYCSLASATCEM